MVEIRKTGNGKQHSDLKYPTESATWTKTRRGIYDQGGMDAGQR